MKRKKYLILTLAVFLVNIGLDRLTKALAEIVLRGQPIKVYLHGLFVLAYTENSGAFLSMGATWPPVLKYAVLAVLPMLVCLAILVYLICREDRVYRIVLLSSVAAGGLSNLFDRLTNQFRVIDFMNFGIGHIRTGILNVADISVTFGVIILIVLEFLEDRKKKE
jgi:signal peptidase II